MGYIYKEITMTYKVVNMRNTPPPTQVVGMCSLLVNCLPGQGGTPQHKYSVLDMPFQVGRFFGAVLVCNKGWI